MVPMRVIAYLYLESPADASLDLEACGYEIDQIYQDQAIPADINFRPKLAQLMVDNQSRPADLLLVNHLESLGNTLDEVSHSLQQFEAAGTLVIALDTASEVTPEPLGLAGLTKIDLLRLAGTIQQQQRRRRLRAGHAKNRIQALPPPGKAPYGYRRGQDRYIVDRAAAPVVNAFVEEFLLYGSLRGAVRFLERKFGKRISVSTGRRWLTHPAYRGDLLYGDGRVIRDTHGAIISRDAAAQIDRLLRRNSQLPPRTAGALRSLAGLVSCQQCGTRFAISKTTVRNQEKTYLYLRPADCPRNPKCKAIAYDEALQKIITQICQDLPQAVAKLSGSINAESGSLQIQALERLQANIQQKNAVLEQLPELVKMDVLDQETADLRRYKLRSEIAEVQQQIAQLPPVNLQELTQAVAIPRFWQDLSEAERRFFFREFMRDIQIVRHNGNWTVELVLVFA
jgi:DNA invertase Pin-like site-specific DNA recombinase